jgi:hypothetical protein
LNGPAGAFRPPWWCRNRHLQTAWGPLFRWQRVPLRRERLTTPDGDFLDLDWLEGGGARAPLLLVLHGLEGSSRSHYAAGLLAEARRRGWRGVVLHFRSCSGELNRLPRLYHSGETGDLDHVVRTLGGRHADAPLVAVGVSLGGNVLLKWLGEQGASAPPALVAGATISAPVDLTACAETLDRGFARWVYTARFMRTMRPKAIAKARAHPASGVDGRAAGRARTFREYDRAVTAPLGGFRDERDYWTRASSGPYIARIRRPVLMIAARDDPFIPAPSLADPAALPAGVRAEYPASGGHCGFLEGRWPWRLRSWAERRAIAFLGACVDGVAAGGPGGEGSQVRA